MKYYFVDEKQRKALKAYKYNGGDTSLIYQYILSPLAQFCVDVACPAWLAPNVITLLGLMCSVLSVVLTLVYKHVSIAERILSWV